MRKILIFILFLLFLLYKDAASLACIDALRIWSESIFPILFPTFIISDLLLSSGIVNTLTRIGGSWFSKVFHTSPCGLYIFLLSLLAGTPTNAKNLKVLYDNQLIDESDITKILSMSLFFNPIFVMKMCGLRVLFILWFANIFVGFLMRFSLQSTNKNSTSISPTFHLGASIETNINILLNILGTITVFLVLSSILPIQSIFLKTIVSGLLEVTSGLNILNRQFSSLFLKELLSLIFLSFGGVSIFVQTKSILKDTSIHYQHLFISRLAVACVSILTLCLIA